MPVFGADPDDDTKEWSEYEGHFVRPQFASKPVRSLTEYFGYHPKMKMTQVFSDEDKVILNGYFSRKLKQGFTEASLRRMIDRFWLTWGSNADRPTTMFISPKKQEDLMKVADIVKDDPVLEWFLDGMPSKSGPFEDPREMALDLLHSKEGLFRYPELVADIIRPDDDRHGLYLVELDNLVMWKEDLPGAPEYDDRFVTMLHARCALPPELESPNRRRLRPKAESLLLAIASIPAPKKLKLEPL
jgi:hypothetical protein